MSYKSALRKRRSAAVARHVAVILVAFPGMGKTTIARELTREQARGQARGQAREQTNPWRAIEQDDFYKPNGRHADHAAYLAAVERAAAQDSANLVLCKNHHTEAQRANVIAALRKHDFPFVVCNLVPSVFAARRPAADAPADAAADVSADSAAAASAALEILLDRIEQRADGSSHLAITNALGAPPSRAPPSRALPSLAPPARALPSLAPPARAPPARAPPRSRQQVYQILKHGFWKQYEEPRIPFTQLEFMDSVENNVQYILNCVKAASL
jgi:predicted kinase